MGLRPGPFLGYIVLGGMSVRESHPDLGALNSNFCCCPSVTLG